MLIQLMRQMHGTVSNQGKSKVNTLHRDFFPLDRCLLVWLKTNMYIMPLKYKRNILGEKPTSVQ